jgi:Ala-tRNA(Pro) deacylase
MSDTITVSPLARVLTRLDDTGVRYELVEHEPTYTACDEARAAGCNERTTAKTLVLLDRERARVAVIPANRRLDLARARRALRAGPHLRLATESEAAARFPAYEPGAVPPFAAEAFPEVVDIRLLYRARILCAAGDHRHSVQIDTRDLLRLTEPRVADICRPTVGEHRFADVPHI